jgi:hypothetical protein
MKKYLMLGLSVLAFVSCNKDNFSSNDGLPAGYTDAKAVETEYQSNFVKTFGAPNANETWGFGSSNSSSKANAMRRAIPSAYPFPGDADASKFLADVPAGVEKLTQNAASVNAYIDESWTGELNIWGAYVDGKTTGGTIYLKGTLDFSNRKFYIAANTEVYLLEGAVLTLRANDAGNLQENCNFYMAANSKIVANGELKLNKGLHIYNHGTIEAPKISTNNNSLLYNVNLVIVTGKISVENNESVVVNDGTITATDMNTAGSGKVQNNGDVTITGTTLVNSNNNTWVNNGHFHTGNFIYNAGSDDVINNCYLEVDEDFNINLGDNPGTANFKMNGGSGVVTKYFNGGGNWNKTYSTGSSKADGGPFHIYMGASSVFKVTETATMNATKANYGVYGPAEGNAAVFQAKKIVAGKANQGYEVTYGGNLAVVTDDHFDNGFSGTYPFIDFKGDAKIYAPGYEDGKPATIEKTNCNPGFNGGTVPPAENPSLHVMAEDLSATDASDFDFNDVVFDVFYVDANTVTIKVLAAGGTLPLRICENDEWEIHKLFDVDETCMVNTGSKYHTAKAPYSQTTKPYVTLTLTSKTWTKDQDTFAAEVNENIKLEVKKNGTWHELTAYQGKPAAKIASPVDIYMKNVTDENGKDASWYPEEYRWPWEKQDFSALFKEYVLNGNKWYVTKKVAEE